MIEAIAVAKKKAEPIKAKAKTGPKPSPLGPRTETVALKCHKPYRKWFLKLVEHLESTPSNVVAKGLAKVAKDAGFEEPPKR